MASGGYDSWVQDVTCGQVDMNSDTFYWMLVDSSYVPHFPADNRRDDVTGEIAGTGYTAGGAATAITTTLDTANDRIKFTFADIVWTGATITNARGVVIYKHRGGASSADELVMYGDFGSDK